MTPTDFLVFAEVMAPPILLLAASFALGYFYRKREEHREQRGD